MNQERVWIDEDWKAYLRPTFDGDTSGYIRADLVQAKDAEIARLRAELDAALAKAEARGRIAGLREAADIAGLNAWKHAGEDDYSRGMDAGAAHQVRACCDAIRAHADKIEGDTVKARDEAIRAALSAREGDDGKGEGDG